jgi:hypothetical protein
LCHEAAFNIACAALYRYALYTSASHTVAGIYVLSVYCPQIFRVLFNSAFPWNIQKDLWLFKAIQVRFIRLPQ